jgi:hypothetical protein
MNITKKFLQLTKKTYPHGTESQLKNQLPTGYKQDKWGNYYLEIGESTTMFTCHLDTASYSETKVNHVIDGKYIKTDGSSILGADDKAGMVVILYMIQNKIPGLYYFFLGEERGCVGSSDVSHNWKELPFSDKINKVISFDRRGTTSVITEQFGGVCCSDEFAQELSTRLNSIDSTFGFRPDPTGIYTDSAQFIDIVPECTNISVGYYNEHSHSETQDIDFLQKLCNAVIKLDWETLPINRDFKKSSQFYSDNLLVADYAKDWLDEDDDFDFSDVDLDLESEYIERFLFMMDVKYDKFFWNGMTLHVEYNNKTEFVATRSEISQFVPELDDYLPY